MITAFIFKLTCDNGDIMYITLPRTVLYPSLNNNCKSGAEHKKANHHIVNHKEGQKKLLITDCDNDIFCFSFPLLLPLSLINISNLKRGREISKIKMTKNEV